MAEKVFEYSGEKITIQYDARRCIHAAECVHGLPGVFDPERKPWINPDAAEEGEITEVVMRCPTGALHFKSDAVEEPAPEPNFVAIQPDGPLYARGRLEILGADGDVKLRDTRVALCRCGASSHKPFCDGSHGKAGFRDAGALGTDNTQSVESESEARALKITPFADGPLGVRGETELRGADGESVFRGNKMFLCRCGASRNKPFCDGSHKGAGFSAD
jgi:CDGSH-type Zn-finger protein/uncharacterized Fe-S cluster protein YjdI